MRTNIHGLVYAIGMPLNKDGMGPASPEETVVTRYQVWDQVCQVICECDNEDDATAIAALINVYWRELKDG